MTNTTPSIRARAARHLYPDQLENPILQQWVETGTFQFKTYAYLDEAAQAIAEAEEEVMGSIQAMVGVLREAGDNRRLFEALRKALKEAKSQMAAEQSPQRSRT